MIMIGPTEAEFVLAALLNLGGAIAVLPVGALLLEHDVARNIFSDEIDYAIQNLLRASKALLIGTKEAWPSFPELLRLEEWSGIEFVFDQISAVAASFDDFQTSVAFTAHSQ